MGCDTQLLYEKAWGKRTGLPLLNYKEMSSRQADTAPALEIPKDTAEKIGHSLNIPADLADILSPKNTDPR
jgi:hypothetical protein